MNPATPVNVKEPGRTDLEATRRRPLSVPATDILETGEAIQVFMDLPGADESSVQVDLDHDVLTVSAEGKPFQGEGLHLCHAEYGDRTFRRSFALGAEIERGGIVAQLSQGVLTLTLPKTKAAGPRRITVSGG